MTLQYKLYVVVVVWKTCCLRFCAMYVPHVSHSGQLGFLEQPLATIADHHDSQAHINFVPADNNKSAAAVSTTCEVAEAAVKSVKERATETSAQPLACKYNYKFCIISESNRGGGLIERSASCTPRCIL
jgi:hypothetical protein